MKTEGKLVQCDYPKCNEHIMLAKIGECETDGGYTRYNNYEPLPDGWGYKDGKDLCPDHHQYYLDMIAEFWHPTEPAHASSNTAEQSVELRVPDDILYTNMPEMNARTEDW